MKFETRTSKDTWGRGVHPVIVRAATGTRIVALAVPIGHERVTHHPVHAVGRVMLKRRRRVRGHWHARRRSGWYRCRRHAQVGWRDRRRVPTWGQVARVVMGSRGHCRPNGRVWPGNTGLEISGTVWLDVLLEILRWVEPWMGSRVHSPVACGVMAW